MLCQKCDFVQTGVIKGYCCAACKLGRGHGPLCVMQALESYDISRRTYSYHCRVPFNIGHFLHEELHTIVNFCKSKKNTQSSLILSNSCQWIDGVVKILCDFHGIQFLDNSNTFDSSIELPYKKASRHLLMQSFNVNWLRDLIFRSYGISKGIKSRYTVLYTRQDALRRRMLESDCLHSYFDCVVHDLSISLHEQVKIFSSASHFVTLEGAHLTNVIFMQPSCKVLSLQVHHKNSWQIHFGTSRLVNVFDTSVVITKQLKNADLLPEIGGDNLCRPAWNPRDKLFNSNVVIDQEIVDIIRNWLEKM